MAEYVGNAYLNVVPKVDKAAAVSAGEGIGGSMGGGLKTIMKGALMGVGMMVMDMAKNAAQTLGQEMTKAFTNYADFEQLKGGVETLFGEDAAATVKANAQAAFQSAGMSANEYMENVTSFSASLISSLGGDTKAAASLADTAMRDMADNANKMGTDMESITNAYQGFAKQNYTMLDNLKLGYGGTKSEMERLLADAEKISGQKFNIDSYADVVQAIHVMQDSMGIAGATSEEAATTISGSMGMAKAAWENFLTAVGDGGREIDMSAAVGNLVESVKTMLANVVPEVAVIISSIAGLIMDALPDSISGPLAEIGSGIASALQTIGTIARGIVVPVMGVLGNAVMGAMGVILPAVQAVVDFVNAEVLPFVGEAVAYLAPLVSGMLADMSGNFNGMLGVVQSVMGAIGSIVTTVWPVVQQAVAVAVNFIAAIIRTVWPVVQSLVTGAMNNIRAVASVVWPFIQNAVQVAAGIISSALDGLSGIIGSVESTFNRIKDAITNPIETAKNFISDGVGRIKDIINNAHLRLPDIKVPHFNINGGEIPWGIGGKGYPPSIGIDWYAKGGYVEGATLIGAGERGGELIWPSYAPYLDRYAEALASRMDAGGNNVYIDGARVNDDAAIQNAMLNLFEVLQRRGAMNVGIV